MRVHHHNVNVMSGAHSMGNKVPQANMQAGVRETVAIAAAASTTCCVLCCAVLSSRVCTDIPLNGIRLRLPLASCRCLWVATARNWKPKPGGVRHSLRPACCSSSANLSVVQSVNPRPTTWTPIGNGVSSLDVPIATGQTMCPSQRGRRWTAGGRGRCCPTRSSLSCRSNRR